MTQHVKLARDRRRRKSRIKALIFFCAIVCIVAGGILSLKDTVEHKPEQMPEETVYQTLQNEPENNKDGETAAGKEDIDATSYDDELSDKDDEVDEIKINPNDFDLSEPLPAEAQSAIDGLLDAVDQAKRITDQFNHSVVRGDTLKDVLELSGLEDDTSKKLIASYPELKNLKPGQQLYWILDNENDLEYMNWLVSEKEERVYERKEDGKFVRQIIEKKSIWKKEVLRGSVSTSFRASLRSQGLDGRQINQLITALQWQFSMNKLKKGDDFAILISREYLENKLTGQGNVEAIHIKSQGKSYYAIQAENGRYYSRQGETLGKGFSRYPIQRQARVSSPFNPKRRHPVTKRIRPHKGVDFALPTGTPVIAPADAIVEKVAYQAGGAGRYIILRHGREYQTVYMHLSRPLVRAGQSVKRGERIALSGNTGISTGAHLHYEFHINGRPVNPLTVKLPGGNSGMQDSERRVFLARAKSVERQLKF
ncbi:murein DD-endopeptidase MepM [Exercitatus varius]|uniref:murein DD-endopeptidase MepM n=1 Tax=Exercitatus varius TaxID=67857 RepID=UPI001EE47897|nr:murein DD-endopeptidase MepM [Exercitatus varius]MDG2944817.1 murein DD-endopeptidase MepM [Exercitatus varius]MDG2956217.1 murein DD-endopeptidase MepM [Exercitatus varius]MDG2958470.1 murein DD-endopeptidase MepM [Exercitatus varius]MDG2963193.1 murein DD-endopeptidase MepM [Exercitatus varius]MDG2965285.1 murein DD-endopeptidase MepM [Exercitatus varius]